MKLYRTISILLLILTSLIVKGQSLNDAKQWVAEGNFTEAQPIIEEAYNKSPNNTELNYLSGVIALNNNDLQQAEQRLTYASQKKYQPAYLQLGRLYAITYRFDKAETEFNKSERANRRKNDALELLDLEREYADRLERMVGRTENITIIDSLVVDKANFLSAYKLSSSAGSILPFNQFFKDHSNNSTPLYTNERRDKVFFTQKNDKGAYKIHTMEQLINNFGNEKMLSTHINVAEGNQCYPFVMSDGLTIYFSSTGHNTLGGYDIYVTRYNLATEDYLAPNHLNMPFNSPFNDYMMVIDEEKGIGWFASDRYQPQDSVCIYTFIPATITQLVNSDDDDYLRQRAMISSIAQTQPEGSDYSQLIALARKEEKDNHKQKGDFEFVINDAVTYRTLNDFQHGAARTLYSRAMDMVQKKQHTDEELAYLRLQYSQGTLGNSASSTILALEKESENLHQEIEALKKQARNEEIRNIY